MIPYKPCSFPTFGAPAGLRECALLTAAGPAASVWSEGNANKADVVPGRIADLVFVRCLGEPNPSPVYLPIRHKCMIENIFANIGLSHHPDSVASHGTALPNTPTILEFESDFKEGWTFITISEPGRDALDQIESRLDASRTRVTPLSVLLLPLENRRTPELCEAAEKLGFFSQALVQVKKAV